MKLSNEVFPDVNGAFFAIRPRLKPETPWPKAHALDPLSRLNAKFWGKGIDQDESKWLKGQSGGRPTAAIDIDGSEVVTGPPDSGCFVLDIEMIESVSRLWVRKDYIQIYDRCDKHCNDVINMSHCDLPPSAVITGHPGIGKCFSSQRLHFRIDPPSS